MEFASEGTYENSMRSPEDSNFTKYSRMHSNLMEQY